MGPRARLVVAALAAAVLLPSAVAAGGPGTIHRDGEINAGYLGECVQASKRAMIGCFVEGLLAEIEQAGDPATHLPRLDVKTRESGGFLAWNCHAVMHEVGRQYAKRNGVTLASLQRAIPRSNDPGCSAGFGMGLVMHLGPQIQGFGGRAAEIACTQLPTRVRVYTCVHGLGHAYMRVHHGKLTPSIGACKRLRAAQAPDCAQGAYHDYWISLGGGDGTTRPKGAIESPRILCAQPKHLRFVRGCWYRAFLERPPAFAVETPDAIRRLCRGLATLQLSGCVAAASLIVSDDPFRQAQVCSELDAERALSCLRALLVHGVAGKPAEQLRLIRACEGMPGGAEAGCYEWLGKALTVVTNGGFASKGCPRLPEASDRRACATGARRLDHALITFS